MQARWGAHGDYEIIVLSPWSVQEAYDETLRAFNLAERFRVPVIVLMDEAVGHLRENLVCPEQVRVYGRMRDTSQPPFGGAQVPHMPAFGQGARLLVTGSTHDAWGYRRTVSPEAQSQLVSRFVDKILDHGDEIERTTSYFCDEPELDIALIAFGFSARSALAAVRQAREAGVGAGLLRLTTLWPFPAGTVRQLAGRARHVLVPEMNRGQMLREVQRVAPKAMGHNRTDGEVITPREIWEHMQEEWL
jgi:2-oxoglutarate ferredoxin oxidoreductase subunit alpha